VRSKPENFGGEGVGNDSGPWGSERGVSFKIAKGKRVGKSTSRGVSDLVRVRSQEGEKRSARGEGGGSSYKRNLQKLYCRAGGEVAREKINHRKKTADGVLRSSMNKGKRDRNSGSGAELLEARGGGGKD